MKIAIIGAGKVGQALAGQWLSAGHQISYGVRRGNSPTPGIAALPASDAIIGADVIVLATPWDQVAPVLAGLGDLTGRVVLDVTNPLRMGADGLELTIGHTTSGGEHVAALAPGAHVVKSCNQTGWENMVHARRFAQPPSMFVAGDDAAAKQVVTQLVHDAGFEPIDAGTLSSSRLLEAHAMLWIRLTTRFDHGSNWAFARITRPKSADEA